MSSSSVRIIAEAGSVHDGSVGNAVRLVRVAAAAGADVIKFQTHIAAAETLRDAPSPAHFADESRYGYFERTAFDRDQWGQIKTAADEAKIEFMSSPFSVEAVELLEDVGVSCYKVASGEVSNLPLLEAIATTGKPIVLSSGMSSWEELDRAVATIRMHHNRLALLQCTSLYPCPSERVGLNVLHGMAERYDLPVGLSDHTLENHAAFAAVALGARLIEKHLTFSRLLYGSDASLAAEPRQFEELVAGIRAIESMLDHPVDKDDLRDLKETKHIFEKSLVSLTTIPQGVAITAGMIAIKKPSGGLPPARFTEVIGRRTRRTIPAHSLIREADIHWQDTESEG